MSKLPDKDERQQMRRKGEQALLNGEKLFEQRLKQEKEWKERMDKLEIEKFVKEIYNDCIEAVKSALEYNQKSTSVPITTSSTPTNDNREAAINIVLNKINSQGYLATKDSWEASETIVFASGGMRNGRTYTANGIKIEIPR